MLTQPIDAPSFPMPRSGKCPFDPPPAYGEARKKGKPQLVKMWNGMPCWILTSYDDVRTVLSDNRFSAMPSQPGFPTLSAAREAVLELPPTILRMDAPEHGRMRRMLTKEFMIKKIDAMRPRIAEVVSDLYDQLEAKGPPIEMVRDFALPLTSTIISEFLGVPLEDREFFQEQSRLKVLLDVDPSIPKQAAARLMAYFEALLRKKAKDPYANNDLLSRLVIDQIQPGHLSFEQAVHNADLLTMAGHETTANQIALGTLTLLQYPQQKELLLAHPELIRNAVDEMLRYHSIAHFVGARVAMEDVEISGQLIRKGEAVYALLGAANRDPAAFDSPDKFDITRSPDHHVGFSYGIHQCLGQPLARAELQTVFSTLFKRFPGLRMAGPFEEIVFKTDHFVYGVEALPLTW